MKAIYLDMDGTIANLYRVDGWLDDLENSNTRPYAQAAPLVHMATLARTLNQLQEQGYKIGVVSWLSKGGTPLYNAEVTEAKKMWLKKHLQSVHFDEMYFIPYGTSKNAVVKHKQGLLFDDEERNRRQWVRTTQGAAAATEENLITMLRALL